MDPDFNHKEGLDGINLVNGNLEANGKSILELLKKEERVQLVDGRVQFLAKFGNQV